MTFTAGQIAVMLNGLVDGNADETVAAIAKIEEADKGDLAFIANPKYEHFLATTKASIVLVNKEILKPEHFKATLIRVEDPYAAFAKLMETYQKLTMKQPKTGIQQPCYIAETASVAKTAYIGAFCFIGENVKIGEHTQVFPGSFLGDDVTVGKNTTIHAGVKIYADGEIGNHVIIHGGAVIGADGFGFAPQADGTFNKIPQLGKVVIEDFVEIGANTTIDRATMGNTHISKNVKIDNLVQIAHNVEIGENTAIAAQTGISGSTKLGKNCITGGQVGLAGHLQLADGTRLGAQSGLSKSVKKRNTDWFGSPAFEYKQAIKSEVIFRQLPDLLDRLRQLEEEVKILKLNTTSVATR